MSALWYLQQVLLDEVGRDLVDAPSGGRAVEVTESFDVAIGDAEVELDDESSAVGFLADYLGQRWVFPFVVVALMGSILAHVCGMSRGVGRNGELGMVKGEGECLNQDSQD